MSYDAMVSKMQGMMHDGPLFSTNASQLWEQYLALLPEAERQHHNCRACKHFIEHYGGLVRIEGSRTVSVMWTSASGIYKKPISFLKKWVEASSITGVFLSGVPQLGTPMNFSDDGVKYTHFACGVSVVSQRLLSAAQQMAAKLEEFKNVATAVVHYKKSTVEAAVSLLRSDMLYRSEKVLGAAEWLLSAYGVSAAGLWYLVATAPTGFCHPRSSMIGSLLDDLESGKGLDDVKRSFAAKMSGTKYQRPTAIAPLGTIVAAEKLVSKLGIERSLERRFCRQDEVQAFWKPKTIAPQSSGVFGHLNATREAHAQVAITWEKFYRDVLPKAIRLDVLMGLGAMPFCGLLTAVHADAPPILQWDLESRRNPVSWYCYAQGAAPGHFNAVQCAYEEVSMLTCMPSMWNLGDEAMLSHHGAGVIMVLKHARDARSPGIALFPEILKSELHGVRSVIEAHSRSKKLSSSASQACGLVIKRGQASGLVVKVTQVSHVSYFKIDRWD